MDTFIGGNPLNRSSDNTPIYTQPRFIPPSSPFEMFPRIKETDVSAFIEHLYFLTMEKNGFSYFYPNLSTGTNLCRFEWHYEYRNNPYELRIGLSFIVSNSCISDARYFIIPHEHYKNRDSTEASYTIEKDINNSALENININIAEAEARLDSSRKSTYNVLYYIELSSPALEIIEFTDRIKLIPSRMIDGKIVSAVVLREDGHSYLSAKPFSDEKVNFLCAILSLTIDKAKLINIERFPSFITPLDKEISLTGEDDINKFYPEEKFEELAIKAQISLEDVDFVSRSIELIDALSCEKTKRKIKNILFSFYSAKETEGINRTVALVSYIACLDAIAKECCPIIRDENGSRQALVQTIVQLLALDELEHSINKWSIRIYNDHRSSYVHGANMRFEAFSQNMDGNKFASLPNALPTGTKPVSKQYQYVSDYKTLKNITLKVLIKYMEKVLDTSYGKEYSIKEYNFYGESTPEAYIGMANEGWVNIT